MIWLLLIWHIGASRPVITPYARLADCEHAMLVEIASHQATKASCQKVAKGAVV